MVILITRSTDSSSLSFLCLHLARFGQLVFRRRHFRCSSSLCSSSWPYRYQQRLPYSYRKSWQALSAFAFAWTPLCRRPRRISSTVSCRFLSVRSLAILPPNEVSFVLESSASHPRFRSPTNSYSFFTDYIFMLSQLFIIFL